MKVNMTYFKITETTKKTSEIIREMREKFDIYIYDEENIDKNFPPPKEITTRYFKENIEADEELKDMSADDLEKKRIKGITLREKYGVLNFMPTVLCLMDGL